MCMAPCISMHVLCCQVMTTMVVEVAAAMVSCSLRVSLVFNCILQFAGDVA